MALLKVLMRKLYPNKLTVKNHYNTKKETRKTNSIYWIFWIAPLGATTSSPVSGTRPHLKISQLSTEKDLSFLLPRKKPGRITGQTLQRKLYNVISTIMLSTSKSMSMKSLGHLFFPSIRR